MTSMCRTIALPWHELIAVTNHIRRIRAVAAARHIWLGTTL